MPTFHVRRNILYAPEDMFSLVEDIEKYPDFLPFCKSLLIHSICLEKEKTFIVAEMTVGYALVQESFLSHVTLDRASLIITMESSDRVFRYLRGRWSFEVISSGCIVDFFIDYSFKSPFTELLIGSMFKNIFDNFVEAFEKRANTIFSHSNRKKLFISKIV